jgi:hypothetical protein
MTETILPPSGPGTVVLDVGAGTGALVLHTPAELDGREIEISLAGAATRTHSQVRARHTGAGVRYAAVYPGLPAGDYTIWRDTGTPAAAVTVAGDRVTNCHWPA